MEIEPLFETTRSANNVAKQTTRVSFFGPGQESERNQRLRELVVSLSAALMRNIARSPLRDIDPKRSDEGELLLDEAEECFRCARIPGVKKELAKGFEAAGYAFMKTVVEIETVKQRTKWKK